MAERNWTIPQQDAISASGGSLLVSAAAGSGKTAVLVERAVGLICGEAQVPADQLLVVTFSNAAAAEMKQRMNARLSAMIAENPENLHLQRQQALLSGAQISTIHSFCLELIRQNFQHLEVSPDFAIADQNELDILRADCAAQSIEAFYADDTGGEFLQLVELLSTGRDDRKVAEVVLKIYEFARSHPFYLDWLEEKQRMYEGDQPASSTVWGKVLLRYAADSLGYCQGLMAEAVALAEADSALEKGYLSAFLSDAWQIDALAEVVGSGDWDAAVSLLRQFVFARLGGVRGDDNQKERAKGLRDKSKKVLEDLRDKYLSATEAEFREDIQDLRPKIALLFSLVKAFDVRFREAKADRRRVDFQDLEHLALELLVEKEGDSFRRTGIAREIAQRYQVVMVDEYQDTNEVQDMIFTCVSDSQKNLFMVGDVKQSIYSFRQAMPEIFLTKKARFFPYNRELPQFPAKIILDTNFRSRETVTQGVNYLFGKLMSVQIGEIDYTGDEILRCGAVYPDSAAAQPELLLLDASAAEPGVDTTQLEAAKIAGKIAAMLESQYAVAVGAGMRPCMPKDFCILLRSPRGRVDTYVKELTARGVAAWSETTDGYLATREVSAVVSLLEALDNPLLDVELVAAMLSPLFAFTDDDIVRIRLAGRGQPFYTALQNAAAENEKSAEFLALFKRLRQAAAILPADKLLLRIYDETDALAVMRAMALGENRAANLTLLVEYAAQYHALGYKRLGGFVGFLGRLKERGGDLAPASGTGDAGSNAVRIMSVHRSKGLEFPIVFLCDSFRQFNKVDLRAGTLLHSKLGFACVRRDQQSRKQFATVPMQAIRLEMERSLLSEELRVLYVALTRAKEKLVITGLCKTEPAKRLTKLYTGLKGDRLPHYAVREANCYADWVLMAMLHHPDALPLRELAGCMDAACSPDSNHWAVSVEESASPETGETAAVPEHTAAPDPALLAEIKRRTAFVYPFQAQTTIPTKLAVSSVAKGQTDPAYRFAARPRFMTGAALTAAEKGNALHKFMQFADYQSAADNLEGEILRMKEQRFLTVTEVDSLQRRRLQKFFRSPLSARMFASVKLLRELKFTAECGPDIVGDFIVGLTDSDKIVLQGVADCVFFELDGAVIVDYKTDAVADEEELVRRYSGQLLLYRRILEKSLGTGVKQCILYSFGLGKEVIL